MDFSDYQDYNDNVTHGYEKTHSIDDESSSWKGAYVAMLVLNIMIFLLGVSGNGIVIWIAGLKMKKSVNIVWYLSLAISDFMFCSSLPIIVVYMATSDWIFGVFMCKFTSFIMFINMFSSIFLLVIISVDRCVSVVFPVWAQNHRTVRKASFVVIFTWLVSVVLSWPSAVFRSTLQTQKTTTCFNNYNSTSIHGTIVISRFVCGFLIPFLIIISCYSIIFWKLMSNRMNKSSKPFKVMSALIATFFVCWLPYHIIVLMEASNRYDTNMVNRWIRVMTTLASANSLLNPFLYAFMGEDFKQKCWRSVLSKIENAIGEETHTTSKWVSVSSSVDRRMSTIV
ncbi:chemokine-like receptor 1 [Scleropages formosus]|nr:chemokine-like receptor 1 [Scleropages formosus]